jgi:hypothetical protein
MATNVKAAQTAWQTARNSGSSIAAANKAYQDALRVGAPAPTAAQTAYAATLQRESAAQKARYGNTFMGVQSQTYTHPGHSGTPAQAQQNGNLAAAANPAPADTAAVVPYGVTPVTTQFGNLLDLTEM